MMLLNAQTSPLEIDTLISKSNRLRRIKNNVMVLVLALAVLVAWIPLISLIKLVIQNGASRLDWEFLSTLPKPVGEEGGGMLNAIVGSFSTVTISAVLGIPFGIAIGIYLSEYSNKQKKLAQWLENTIRMSIEALSTLPSIVVGLFSYTVVVMTMGRFSAFAGGVALAIIIVPMMARSTEELLRIVPTQLREAGLALGIPRWKVVLKIVVRGQLAGLSTSMLLAIARASGECAPLLFTAFGNPFLNFKIDQPMSTLPTQIFTYAISPFDEWHKQAWAGALLLLIWTLVTHIGVRMLVHENRKN